MEWEVLFDAEFADWFEAVDEGLQDEIFAHVELLRRFGPNLGRPRVDSVKGSKYSNMKELRIQYQGDPSRILFAFDPSRCAILLVGGNKAETIVGMRNTSGSRIGDSSGIWIACHRLRR